DGPRAEYALGVIADRGYTIKHHARLGDDTGYSIRTREGPVINLYDTGSILVSGNGRGQFGDVDALRMPDTSSGVLVVASDDDDALLSLSMQLRGWGHAVEVAFF